MLEFSHNAPDDDKITGTFEGKPLRLFEVGTLLTLDLRDDKGYCIKGDVIVIKSYSAIDIDGFVTCYHDFEFIQAPVSIRIGN